MSKIIDSKLLIELYKKGYFPMAENAFDSEINFYKPKKRFIIPINTFHVPRKLLSDYKKNKFNFKINTNFDEVINSCSKINEKRESTWINPIIIDSYKKLYLDGFAKSIECYENNQLVGGLYGVCLGQCFFGESMFSLKKNTSKFCLLYLIAILFNFKFKLLDSQFFNPHLLQFGAYEIISKEYDLILKKNLLNSSNFPENFDYQESISILQFLSQRS